MIQRTLMALVLAWGLLACSGPEKKEDNNPTAETKPPVEEVKPPVEEEKPPVEETPPEETGEAPGTASPEQIAAGETVYKKCKGCHGTQEKPGKAAPHLFAKEWSDEYAAYAKTVIIEGQAAIPAKSDPNKKGKMPAFGTKLSEEEIDAVVAYISQ